MGILRRAAALKQVLNTLFKFFTSIMSFFSEKQFYEKWNGSDLSDTVLLFLLKIHQKLMKLKYFNFYSTFFQTKLPASSCGSLSSKWTVLTLISRHAFSVLFSDSLKCSFVAVIFLICLENEGFIVFPLFFRLIYSHLGQNALLILNTLLNCFSNIFPLGNSNKEKQWTHVSVFYSEPICTQVICDLTMQKSQENKKIRTRQLKLVSRLDLSSTLLLGYYVLWSCLVRSCMWFLWMHGVHSISSSQACPCRVFLWWSLTSPLCYSRHFGCDRETESAIFRIADEFKF